MQKLEEISGGLHLRTFGAFKHVYLSCIMETKPVASRGHSRVHSTRAIPVNPKTGSTPCYIASTRPLRTSQGTIVWVRVVSLPAWPINLRILNCELWPRYHASLQLCPRCSPVSAAWSGQTGRTNPQPRGRNAADSSFGSYGNALAESNGGCRAGSLWAGLGHDAVPEGLATALKGAWVSQVGSIL